MVHVSIDVNEPYKVFYYQKKYTIKMFIYFLVIYNAMAAIAWFSNPTLWWVWILYNLLTIITTVALAFPYSIILTARAKRDLTDGTETEEGNYKLIYAKAPYIGNFTDLVKVTYNCDRLRLCFGFTDNQKELKLYGDDTLACIFQDMVYPSHRYMFERFFTYEESVQPINITKIVFGKKSKIILSCEFEYDEEIVNNIPKKHWI